MFAAIHNDHEKSALYLLEHGADPSGVAISDSSEHIYLNVWDAGAGGHVWKHSPPLLRSLIRQGVDLNQTVLMGGGWEGSPLCLVLAAGGDSDEMINNVELLIAHGAKVTPIKSKVELPIVCAAEYTGPRVCHLLLARGANVNSVDADGHTPLIAAMLFHQEQTALYLLDAGANPKVVTYRDNNPCLTVWSAGLSRHDKWVSSSRMLRALIAHGADVNQQSNSNHDCSCGPIFFILNVAGDSGKIITDLKLLIAAGAKVNLPTSAGESPLMRAASSNGPRVGQFLISQGADVNYRNKAWDETSLTRARECKNYPFINLLKQAGAN